MGITITNVALIASLLFAVATHDTRGVLAAAARTGAMVLAILGATAVSALVFGRILIAPAARVEADTSWAARIERHVTGPSVQQVTRYAAPDPVRRLRHFPTDVVNAFAPRALATTPLTTVGAWPYTSGFTLQQAPGVFEDRDPLGIALLLLLVLGGYRTFATPRLRPIALGSMGILGFCWVLSTWGRETFLYSQHWHLAAVVLLSGVMRMGTMSTAMTWLLGAVVAVVATHNALTVWEMLATLAAAPRA